MATTTETLLTAEEFQLLPDADGPIELVKGHVVRMNPPAPRHGEVCFQVAFWLGEFLIREPVGRVVINDSGIITQRGPDTVRGADVAFYSYLRVPKGPLPSGYLPVPPDVVFEVLSPSDRRAETLAKVAEYLAAGVRVVCVLDSQDDSVQVHDADKPLTVLSVDNNLELPDVLGGFCVPVAKFFQ